MARRPAVEQHPARELIDVLLVRGVPYRAITRQIADCPSREALRRYRGKHLAELMAKTTEVEELRADNLVQELNRLRTETKAFLDGVKRELTDPATGELILADPAANHEISYWRYDKKGDRQRLVRANLAELVDRVLNKIPGAKLNRISSVRTDIRTLFLPAIDRMTKFMELLAEIEGQIRREVHVTINDMRSFQLYQAIIMKELKKHPEVRPVLAAALRTATEEMQRAVDDAATAALQR